MQYSPRVESAHVVVAFHTTVHDSSVTLLADTLLGDLRVDPIGETPHAVIDFTKLDGCTGVVLHSCLEVFVEVAVVKENVRIVEPTVEVALDRLEGLDDTVQFLVSRENDEGSVSLGSLRPLGVNGHAASSKDLVILFADFPISRNLRSARGSLYPMIETQVEGRKGKRTEWKAECRLELGCPRETRGVG